MLLSVCLSLSLPRHDLFAVVPVCSFPLSLCFRLVLVAGFRCLMPHIPVVYLSILPSPREKY